MVSNDECYIVYTPTILSAFCELVLFLLSFARSHQLSQTDLLSQKQRCHCHWCLTLFLWGKFFSHHTDGLFCMGSPFIQLTCNLGYIFKILLFFTLVVLTDFFPFLGWGLVGPKSVWKYNIHSLYVHITVLVFAYLKGPIF